MIEQLQQALSTDNKKQVQDLIQQISQQQTDPQIQISLVNICLQQGLLELALQCFARAAVDQQLALQVLPLVKEPEINQHRELALALLFTAYQAQPDCLAIILTLADHLLASDRTNEAQVVLAETLAKQPHAEVLARLAETYYRQGKFTDAKACATVAMEMNPSEPQSFINLAVIEKALVNLPEAARLFSTALEMDQDNFYAHINLAHLSLMSGQFDLGWLENEWRWQDSHCRQETLPLPLWSGQTAPRHLLVWADQGLGDQIMYLSLLNKLSCRYTVKIDARLHPLLPEDIAYLPADYTGDFAEFDGQISLGSLPRYLIHSFADFGPRTSFLQAANKVMAPPTAASRRIGFSWRGGRFGTEREQRSLNFSIWQRLIKLPEVQWVNLQYDTSEQERQWLAEHGVETPDFDLKNDLQATGQLLSQLDGYLGVDNSTLHLAGALGVNTLLLLPTVADWRWFTEAEKCYWYQSVRLNRCLPLADDQTATTNAVPAQLVDQLLAG